MSRTRIALSAILSLTILLAGCSTKGSPTNVSTQPAPSDISKHSSSPSRKDGTIISMTLVHAKGENSNIKIYKMFYWSQGYKVEAFLTEPKNAGSNDYPLFVSCHGGYIYNSPTGTPKSSIVNVLSLSSVAKISYDQTETVGLYPEYRGYGQSQGLITDNLHSNTIDTENAIKAANTLSVVNEHFVSLEGVSMGGTVALQLVSNPKYSANVTSAVIVSPFTGWDIAMSWAEKHPDNSHAKAYISSSRSYDGHFDPSKPGFKQSSIHISQIDPGIPILIMEGTDDHHGPWQAVKILAQKMKEAGDRVQFHLVPGGNHGLVGKYAKSRDTYIRKWSQNMLQ